MNDEHEKIVEIITARIKAEQLKHSNSIPNWQEIAARKIIQTLDIKLKQYGK